MFEHDETLEKIKNKVTNGDTITKKDIPDSLQSDKEFMIKAVAIKGNIFRHASDNLKNDRDIVSATFSAESPYMPALLDLADIKLQQELALENKDLVLKYTKQGSISKDEASKILGYSTEDLKIDRKDHKENLSNEIKNKMSQRRKSVELGGDDSETIEKTNKSFLERTNTEAVIHPDKSTVIPNILEITKTEVSPKPPIEFTAETKQYLNEVKRNFAQLFTKIHENNIKNIEPSQQTSEKIENKTSKEQALEIVDNNGFKLLDLAEFQNDIDVVLRAVSNNPKSIYFASDQIRGNKDVFLDLAVASPLIIEFSSNDLRNDPVFVREYFGKIFENYREAINSNIKLDHENKQELIEYLDIIMAAQEANNYSDLPYVELEKIKDFLENSEKHKKIENKKGIKNLTETQKKLHNYEEKLNNVTQLSEGSKKELTSYFTQIISTTKLTHYSEILNDTLNKLDNLVNEISSGNFISTDKITAKIKKVNKEHFQNIANKYNDEIDKITQLTDSGKIILKEGLSDAVISAQSSPLASNIFYNSVTNIINLIQECQNSKTVILDESLSKQVNAGNSQPVLFTCFNEIDKLLQLSPEAKDAMKNCVARIGKANELSPNYELLHKAMGGVTNLMEQYKDSKVAINYKDVITDIKHDVAKKVPISSIMHKFICDINNTIGKVIEQAGRTINSVSVEEYGKNLSKNAQSKEAASWDKHTSKKNITRSI